MLVLARYKGQAFTIRYKEDKELAARIVVGDFVELEGKPLKIGVTVESPQGTRFSVLLKEHEGMLILLPRGQIVKIVSDYINDNGLHHFKFVNDTSATQIWREEADFGDRTAG